MPFNGSRTVMGLFTAALFLPTGDSAALAVAFSPGGQMLASGSFDTRLRLWEARTWEVKTVILHSAEVRAVLFSPDGKTLLTRIGSGKVVFLWDSETGQLKRTLKSEHEVFSIALTKYRAVCRSINTGSAAESSKSERHKASLSWRNRFAKKP